MIYLDNAATTRVDDKVNKVIEKYNSELYFNPSALYGKGSDLSNALNGVRDKITKVLGCEPNARVIFTSGATEANNLAIFGSNIPRGKTYIFGIGEHPSVYNCAIDLKNKNVDVKFAQLNSVGEIDIDKLKELLDENVGFVSVMLVSNETGAINKIKEIATLIKDKSPRAIFHVDAVQGFCKVPFNMSNCMVDLCTISAHKIYGPKGVGALIIRPNLNIKNINFGGGQEKGTRSGTENVSGILGFGEVIENLDYNYIKELKDKFLSNLKPIEDKIQINGNGSPYILSLSIPGIRGETLVHMLEGEGVLLGTGSACSSSKIENRTLSAMGRTKEQVLGAIRISFGKYNTLEEVDFSSKLFVEKVLLLINMYERK